MHAAEEHRSSGAGPVSVLLIDDEPDVLDMLELSVSSMGFRTVTAGGGEEALAIAKEQPIDVAVVDLRMPGLDGIATTHALKELDPEMDVVIATAYVSETTRSDCLASGASDFITKPFTLDTLEAFLRRVVARRQARVGDTAG